jgi:NAD+ dependent glucose-6-phosphate dehydrogenase
MPDPILKVLVTGSSGLIGGVVIRTLGDTYTFSGLDRTQTADAPDIPTTVADVSNFDAIRPAFDGMDAVIHLAADAGMHAPWTSVLPNNIVATYNVFEAARQAGVPRLIFASSNHAVGMFELDEPYGRIRQGNYANLDPATFPRIDNTVRIRPDGYYGMSKAFGEAMGAYYADNFGMSVICLRIGTVNHHNSPIRDVRHMATWLSHRDLAQLIDRCLSVASLRFEIFYGVSGNTWHLWDLAYAARVLGYVPQDNAETYRTG